MENDSAMRAARSNASGDSSVYAAIARAAVCPTCGMRISTSPSGQRTASGRSAGSRTAADNEREVGADQPLVGQIVVERLGEDRRGWAVFGEGLGHLGQAGVDVVGQAGERCLAQIVERGEVLRRRTERHIGTFRDEPVGEPLGSHLGDERGGGLDNGAPPFLGVSSAAGRCLRHDCPLELVYECTCTNVH